MHFVDGGGGLIPGQRDPGELEGALRKVLAYSRFNGEKLSIQMAKEVLRDLLSIKNRQISVENI